MTDEREHGSVLMLPPDDEERALLEHVRDRLQVDPARREQLRARLDGIDDRTVQRARRDAQRRTAVRALAIAAALALTVVGGRWALQGQFGPSAAPPPTMVMMTAAGQTQTITPVSGIDVEVRPETQLTVLPGVPTGVLLLLAEGVVVVDYRNGPGGPPLEVLAGDVHVRVTGTRFSVARSGDHVTVSVDRGSVAVAWPGGEAALGVGGTWRSWPQEDPTEPDGRLADGSGDPDPADATASAAPEPEAIGAADPAALGTSGPAAVPAPAGTEPARPTPAGDPVALATVEPGAPDESTLFARIQLERGAGVPAADRLTELQTFLRAYPDSSFGEEVRALEIEALADTGQDRAALDAADAFCARYGEGQRRREVRWIEARVAHGRLGDCTRALPAYRELAAGTGPRVGEAMYGLGVCAYETGRTDEARDALQAATAFDLDAPRAEHARRLLESL